MGLDAQEEGEVPVPGGGGAVSKESTQLMRRRAVSKESTQLMRRRSSVEGVDTAQEAQGCQAGEAPDP